SVLLPQPERPNSPTTPGVGSSKCASSSKVPRIFFTETCSIIGPACAAPAARTIGRATDGHPQKGRKPARAEPLRHRLRGFATRCKERGGACAFHRGYWKRK